MEKRKNIIAVLLLLICLSPFPIVAEQETLVINEASSVEEAYDMLMEKSGHEILNEYLYLINRNNTN